MVGKLPVEDLNSKFMNAYEKLFFNHLSKVISHNTAYQEILSQKLDNIQTQTEIYLNSLDLPPALVTKFQGTFAKEIDAQLSVTPIGTKKRQNRNPETQSPPKKKQCSHPTLTNCPQAHQQSHPVISSHQQLVSTSTSQQSASIHPSQQSTLTSPSSQQSSTSTQQQPFLALGPLHIQTQK